jgi:hypothetical protein
METKANPPVAPATDAKTAKAEAGPMHPEAQRQGDVKERKSRKDRLMELRGRMYAQHPLPVAPPDMVELIDIMLDN